MSASNDALVPYWRTILGEQEAKSIADAVLNGQLSDGQLTNDFERRLCETLNVSHGIAVPSGSAALLLSLMAIGVGPGDEVLVPAATWIATAHAATILGARVVLVDTLEERPVMDPSKVEALISSKTKAIIVVHLAGRAAPVEDLKKISDAHGVILVEDACQGLFSKNEEGFLGTRAHIGCFSFGVSKLLTTGQGGMVVTDDESLNAKMRLIKAHGVTAKGYAESYMGPGFNFKYSDLKAAIGLVQLKNAKARIEHSIRVYETYQESLAGPNTVEVCEIHIDKGEVPLWTEVNTSDVASLQSVLLRNKIESRMFHVSLHHAPHLNQGKREFPNAEKHANSILILPSGPSQPIENIRRTCAVIKSI